mmetsp:Transcript_71643/g.191141  ORF Transcript_71643/g.191141 Transcript_71643/m.191141 type:complete len:266 (+) Transcript_71643:137-934(+)
MRGQALRDELARRRFFFANVKPSSPGDFCVLSFLFGSLYLVDTKAGQVRATVLKPFAVVPCIVWAGCHRGGRDVLRVVVRDDKSTNGTWVNGQRIRKGAKVMVGQNRDGSYDLKIVFAKHPSTFSVDECKMTLELMERQIAETSAARDRSRSRSVPRSSFLVAAEAAAQHTAATMVQRQFLEYSKQQRTSRSGLFSGTSGISANGWEGAALGSSTEKFHKLMGVSVRKPSNPAAASQAAAQARLLEQQFLTAAKRRSVSKVGLGA